MHGIVNKIRTQQFRRKHGGLTVKQVAQLYEDGQGLPCVPPCNFGHRVVEEAIKRRRGHRRDQERAAEIARERIAAGSRQSPDNSS